MFSDQVLPETYGKLCIDPLNHLFPGPAKIYLLKYLKSLINILLFVSAGNSYAELYSSFIKNICIKFVNESPSDAGSGLHSAPVPALCCHRAFRLF